MFQNLECPIDSTRYIGLPKFSEVQWNVQINGGPKFVLKNIGLVFTLEKKVQ